MDRERNSSDERWRRRDEARYRNDADYEDEDAYWDDHPRRRQPPLRATRASYTAQTPSRTTRAPYPQTPSPRPRLRRKRSVWPLLLTGCAIGVIFTVLTAAVVVIFTLRSLQAGNMPTSITRIVGGGMKTMTRSETVTVPLTTISQVQVCDSMGNVTMKVDPGVSQTTVTMLKTVHAASQAAANQEFQRIAAQVQPPTTLTTALTCARPQSTAVAGTPTTATSTNMSATNNTDNALTVNVTFPNNANSTDTVDITITLPPAAIQNNALLTPVDIEAPLGTVSISGVSGLLDVNGGLNVNIQNAALAAGSQLQTSQGKITFNGYLEAPTDASQTAQYTLQGEYGVDVTLPVNTNVTLDANTNQGTGVVTNAFDSSGANKNQPSYYGPLNPAGETKPVAVLVLDVGTGNVNIHEQA